MREFSVPEMSCGHCKAAIEKAVVGIDPDADVRVDLESRRVGITSAEPNDALIAAMKAAGYDAKPV